MSLRDFMLFTFVGAGIWNIILAIIGFYLYDIREQIYPYLGYILIGLGVGFTIYLVVKARRNNRQRS
jgi:membrane protein DedA with SNARE-associated domain